MLRWLTRRFNTPKSIAARSRRPRLRPANAPVQLVLEGLGQGLGLGVQPAQLDLGGEQEVDEGEGAGGDQRDAGRLARLLQRRIVEGEAATC